MTGRPVAPNAANSQLCAFAPDRRERDAAAIRGQRLAVAIGVDRHRQRARDDRVGAERRGQLLLVADAVLRRDDRRRRRIAERAAQRLDRAVGVVRFHRHDRQIGVNRLDGGEVARRVRHVVADGAQQSPRYRPTAPAPTT